jgi:hypothetical protein
MSLINPELASQIERAIEAIPLAHCEALADRTVVVSPEAAFVQIQDWAFTQGHAFVIESRSHNRVRFDCIYHKKETRNTRKTEEKDRRRVETHVRGTDCKYQLYVSLQKKYGSQWVLCYSKNTTHNHPPVIDLFQLPPHRE